MTFLLPLVALALAALGFFLSRAASERRFEGGRGIALLLAAFVGAGIVSRFGPEIDRTPTLIGLFLGVIAVAAGEFLGGWVATLALGVAAASALHLLPATGLPAAQLALMGGAGLGAVAFGKGGATTALVAILVAATDNLGMRHSDVAGAAFLGSQLGLAATIGALLAGYVPPKLAMAKPVAIGILVLLTALFATKPLEDGGLLISAGLGALGGLILHWLFADDEPSPLRIGMAVVIGVGLATIAFGLGRGAGMALSLLAAGGVLLGVGDRRAFLTLGPLVGLVLFRVLREAGTGATRALDIAQHYTLLALVLGAVVPLLPVDWMAGGRRLAGGGSEETHSELPTAHRGLPTAAGTFLWGLLILAIPPLVIVIFGMRGAIGFVVGLGLSGLFQAMRGAKDLSPLAIGSGMAGATILALKPLADKADLTRDEKMHMLLVWGVGIVVIAGILAFLSRPTQTEEKTV
ncbi:hypothetical protein EON79_07590 [bacterium]|nr:MAG: hypothetical protein EON79_07590 [bacterium]